MPALSCARLRSISYRLGVAGSASAAKSPASIRPRRESKWQRCPIARPSTSWRARMAGPAFRRCKPTADTTRGVPGRATQRVPRTGQFRFDQFPWGLKTYADVQIFGKASMSGMGLVKACIWPPSDAKPSQEIFPYQTYCLALSLASGKTHPQ